ncbi:hypothetical protein NUW54_g4546 [Trametes sanguinea]|uniref:Uncharacterized protein n=1 Tax=Trametes sanguinea TaxID=158606 RepID=A0ACC1Q144_9APHY|nr:hypothetical protein NUW54_g4546 [Trametes sanguinea]
MLSGKSTRQRAAVSIECAITVHYKVLDPAESTPSRRLAQHPQQPVAEAAHCRLLLLLRSASTPPSRPTQQQPSATPNSANPYNGFNGYNMLGMGLPQMNVLGQFAYNGQMANFAQQLNQQRLPSLTIPTPQASPYSPAALTAALSAQNNATYVLVR